MQWCWMQTKWLGYRMESRSWPCQTNYAKLLYSPTSALESKINKCWATWARNWWIVPDRQRRIYSWEITILATGRIRKNCTINLITMHRDRLHQQNEIRLDELAWPLYKYLSSRLWRAGPRVNQCAWLQWTGLLVSAQIWVHHFRPNLVPTHETWPTEIEW